MKEIIIAKIKELRAAQHALSSKTNPSARVLRGKIGVLEEILAKSK